MILLQIFYSVILPIFVMIGVGVALDRCCRPDLQTLVRLNFYVFVPAFLFMRVLDAEIAGGTMLRIAAFVVVHLAILYAVSGMLFSRGPFRDSQAVLSMGTIFYNCGNYGIPLVVVAFGDEYIGILAVFILTQNLLNFTLGIWLVEKHSPGILRILARMLKLPVIHAIIGALFLRWLQLGLPGPVRVPLDFLADGLVPVALVTLGVQLSRSALAKNLIPLSALTLGRLVVSPLLAAALVPLFGFSAAVSSLLIVVTGLPVAVNVYILAAEYKRDEVLASQAVFWTTLLSAVSVSVLLAICQS